MRFENPGDDEIRSLLAEPRTWSVVGCSPHPGRDSHDIARLLLGRGNRVVPVRPGWQSELLAHISMIEHMRDFTRGLVDTREVAYYVSLTVFFLFLTLKVVESRRWK